jgi:hypothetical protein
VPTPSEVSATESFVKRYQSAFEIGLCVDSPIERVSTLPDPTDLKDCFLQRYFDTTELYYLAVIASHSHHPTVHLWYDENAWPASSLFLPPHTSARAINGLTIISPAFTNLSSPRAGIQRWCF